MPIDEGNTLQIGTLSAIGERVDRIVPFGTLLLLSDAGDFLRYGETLKRGLASHKIMTALDFTDSAQLFAFGDKIRGVVALGTDYAPLARYFAGVMNVPAILIPTRIDGEKLVSERVSVREGSVRVTHPAPLPALVYADTSLMTGAAEGYARVCGWLLTLFDRRLAAVYTGKAIESTLSAAILSEIDSVNRFSGTNTEEIFRAEYRLSLLSRTVPRGCVGVLSREKGEYGALEKLTAVYAVFFKSGYLRPYACPDRSRMLATANACRTLWLEEMLWKVFERNRRMLYLDLQEIVARLPAIRRTYLALGGKLAATDKREWLRTIRTLPEKGGFSALTLMREFGLLEEKCSGKKYRRS
ncbi:MAG: hypothetical protein ACI4U2_07305 [Christensenellaceae bacterium]